jgi:hypothetical protein
MDENQSPPVSAVLPAALILSIIGWTGLAALFFFTVPTVGPRWSFFFLAVLAVTGLALPLMAFINRRFPSNPPASTGVILREATWMGIYFPTLAWLQIGRVLIPSLALLLAVGLILIELLLRLREKSQWKP